jgi:hypothetical protein
MRARGQPRRRCSGAVTRSRRSQPAPATARAGGVAVADAGAGPVHPGNRTGVGWARRRKPAAVHQRHRPFLSRLAGGSSRRTARPPHVLIAVSEAVTNALQHGAPPVRVQAFTAGGVARVRVHNPGLAAVFATAGYHRPSTAGGGGIGLWVARQLADVVTTHTRQGGDDRRAELPADSSAVAGVPQARRQGADNARGLARPVTRSNSAGAGSCGWTSTGTVSCIAGQPRDLSAALGPGAGVEAGGLPGVGVGREGVAVVPVARKPVSHPILRTCRSRQ